MPNDENNMMKGSLYITFDVDFPKVTFQDSDREGKRVAYSGKSGWMAEHLVTPSSSCCVQALNKLLLCLYRSDQSVGSRPQTNCLQWTLGNISFFNFFSHNKGAYTPPALYMY